MTAPHNRLGPDSLRVESNSHIAPTVERAFAQIMHQIALGTDVVAVIGPAGTGKTFLLRLVEEACIGNELVARLAHRGDLANLGTGERCDVLLIDEADCIRADLLKILTNEATKVATSTIFACAQDRDNRFGGKAAVVQISGLMDEEAEEFVQRTAVTHNLFSPDALKLLVGAAGGSIRLLRLLAGLAVFCAAREGRAQVASHHVTEAFASRIIGPAESELNNVSPAFKEEPPVSLDEGVSEWNALCVDMRIAKWRSITSPISFCFGIFWRALASSGLITAVALGILTFSLGPALHMLPPGTLSGSAIAESSRSDRVRRHDLEQNLALFAEKSQPKQIRAASLFGSLWNQGDNISSWTRPLFPSLPRTATVQAEARTIVSQNLNIMVALDAIGLSVSPEVRELEPLTESPAPQSVLELVKNVLVVDPSFFARSNKRSARDQHQPASSGGLILTGFSALPFAERAGVSDSNAELVFDSPQVLATDVQSNANAGAVVLAAADPIADRSFVSQSSVLATAALARVVTPIDRPSVSQSSVVATAALARVVTTIESVDQAKAAKDASDQAKAAKDAADQAKAAKDAADQAKAAKDAADQAKAAKDAADQAKAAKDAADQAKAAKDAADQAKAAKDAADQAKAAKDAADQAKGAKDAADQAKATKDAADQAKAAKDAADQAKAAKDAADQAKAAKDAADQAKAAKDAADQAKAAKDAADQAKAAKDAADQAKAAKDAADQAKAAKDAADQAKAAKDAADQAKAAKDATDQAKAAKDAADQAKAAKDAADQAKAAKDAADQAKAAKDAADQAKAAKDAADQAKAAKDAADQAKAAKDAADQAKAAKDAADQAQAAKDAADQAKAAKDAADQAKAAKDAAEQAKAAKDAADQAKAAKDAIQAAKLAKPR